VNSMKAFPFDLPMLTRSLHLVSSPCGEKKALRPSSSVSKERPWTKSSSLPSCSSFSSVAAAGVSAAGVSSALAGDSSSELDDPDEDEAALAFLAGAASDEESLSLPDEEDEAAAFLAGAFLAGAASDELSLSDEELDSAFLATFLEALATTLTLSDDDEESESDDEDSTTFFFCGTTAFSVFLEALLFDPADTFEAALDLFFGVGSGDELLDEELDELLELEDGGVGAFFLDFLSFLAGTAATVFSFLLSAFFDLFFSSTLAFLTGASSDDESEATTTFFDFLSDLPI